MENLNFKSYHLKIKNTENKQYVFDEIRKKYFLLTAEEWVRQNCIQLIHEKNFKNFISLKKKYLLIILQNDTILWFSIHMVK